MKTNNTNTRRKKRQKIIVQTDTHPNTKQPLISSANLQNSTTNPRRGPHLNLKNHVEKLKTKSGETVATGAQPLMNNCSGADNLGRRGGGAYGKHTTHMMLRHIKMISMCRRR
jgi:hypothetical protein